MLADVRVGYLIAAAAIPVGFAGCTLFTSLDGNTGGEDAPDAFDAAAEIGDEAPLDALPDASRPVEVLFAGEETPTDLVRSVDDLYWTRASGGGGVSKAPMGGGEVVSVTSTPTSGAHDLVATSAHGYVAGTNGVSHQ